MKKVVFLISIIFISICLTGCGKSESEQLAENIKKMELTGNLVTYEAYYHNIIEYKTKAGTGITHWFEKDRMLFAEYTGTIKLGVDLSKVDIDVKGNEIIVSLPQATVIGEPSVDKNDFNANNFIESKDGINKNPLTIEDSTAAYKQAQQNMKDSAVNDNELLSLARDRAKVLIAENIKQFSNLSEDKYTITWK